MDFINYWQALPKAAILAAQVKVPARQNLLRDEFVSSLYYCGGDAYVAVIEGDNCRLQGLVKTDPRSFMKFYKGL